jgi:5'-methylthioadenosine phosphorylase
MRMIAVIAGVEALSFTEDFRKKLKNEISIETPFGRSSPIKFLEINGKEVAVMFRHGIDKIELAAPFVNYRANIYALKEIGVERIVSLNLTGSINPLLKIGDLIIPDDFIDFTKRRKNTFYENKGYGHVRMYPPFCPEVRTALINACEKNFSRVLSKGVYICWEGPRLETPAEVRLLKLMGGDIVGMTLATEAALAKELEMCYASVCFVMNYAEGVFIDEQGKHVQIPEVEREKKESSPFIFSKILPDAINQLPPVRGCQCKDAMKVFKQRGIIGDDWHSWVSI